MTQRIKLWDLPTRLFHWSLALLILAAVITGNLGGSAIFWHGRIGIVLVGLIAFRLVWGFIGSTHARFANFLPTPSSLKDYLAGRWHGLGHNPLGAFSVLALLALIIVQLATGLMANDDIAFQGYLAGLVGSDLSNRMTGLHKLAINILIPLIGLHLAAIAFYTLVKKEKLIMPMITGWKEIDAAKPRMTTTGGGPLALIIALLIALAAAYAASGEWIAPPPPPASTAPAAPTW